MDPNYRLTLGNIHEPMPSYSLLRYQVEDSDPDEISSIYTNLIPKYRNDLEELFSWFWYQGKMKLYHIGLEIHPFRGNHGIYHEILIIQTGQLTVGRLKRDSGSESFFSLSR